jgi:phage gp36-like protein
LKIEYLTDTTIAKIDNLKDTMTSPDFKLLETKLNKVTSEIEKINHNLWEFPISKIFARLLSEFCCNCSFKLLSASDSGEKRLDVSMSNSDDSL